MANGSYGSNDNRRFSGEQSERRANFGSFFSELRERAEMLSPERWVDIVFCIIFVAAGIAIICNWSEFMNALFFNFWLPIIVVGCKVLIFVAVVAIVIWFISLRFRRRRFW